MADIADRQTNLLQKSIQVLVPQPCYDEYFVKFNFFEPDCSKIVISKCLGFSIILGSVLVKLPQIIKILKARSAEGVSLLSVLLELVAISANVSYGYARGFPFSAYGEGLFLALQTSAIGFLVLLYSGMAGSAVLFILSYGSIMAYLLSPVCPIALLAAFQSLNIGIVIVAKLIQAWANFKNGGTGQLSVVTVFMLFTGSMARIFTSVQETGDQLVIISYVAATVCNGIVFAQILYYWNKKPKAD